MDLFNALNLIGGLCLFLFGMTLMGQALERRAGNKLKTLLERITANKFAGLMTGLGVTAIMAGGFLPGKSYICSDIPNAVC